MKTEKRRSTSEFRTVQALQWAAFCVAVQRSECFEIEGALQLGKSGKPRDFIRWRFDPSVRYGEVPEKGAVCFRSIEESVFLRMVAIQVQCFRNVIEGHAEDPAHLKECRALMESYVRRHGDRIRIPSGEMVNRGLDFLARNWRTIKQLTNYILKAPDQRMNDADIMHFLNREVRQEPGKFLLNTALAPAQRLLLARAS
jgi:hypothetical protein